MDRRPIALYLACAGEIVLAIGAAMPHHSDGAWVALAALGLTVAALGIAGCAHLGLRRWGSRIALAGFVAQGAWLFGPHANVVFAAAAVSTLGLAIAAGAHRHDRIGLAVVVVAFAIALEPFDLVDPTRPEVALEMLGLSAFAAVVFQKLRWLGRAAREAPVMPVDAHVVVGSLSRSVWLRCAPGIAFGVLMSSVPMAFVPERVGMYAFLSLFGATALALAAFALRTLQLSPIARVPLTIAGALAAWSAAVFVGHTLILYLDVFGRFGNWEPGLLFVVPQLATVVATTLAMIAVASRLEHDGHTAAAGRMRAQAVATATLSLIAVMSIGCLIGLRDPSDLGAAGVILLTATLHLLSSGLAANALAAAARTFAPNQLPRAKLV